ncbi:MAG: sulfite exporter TauE/SafE family protein [Sphingomonadaceae bacterium]|nr:sulfite exporter TauE/SafE family protein [Sphingomonadaceae bacterium]
MRFNDPDDMLIVLLILLGLAIFAYGVALARAALAERAMPGLEALALGAVVNFFDTLGIGSFATTTAWFKFRRMVPDRLIPQTLLCGLTPPAMTESIVFLIAFRGQLDKVLLFSCVMAVLAGGLVGVPLVTRARVWVVQTTVAIGLILAATAFAMQNLDLFPGGGTATSLPLGLMIVAIAANFIFGILANFGVGNYAPTLVMLSLMGMDPHLSFPIMAGGAALMGAGSSFQHVRIGQVDMKVVLGLAIGGIPAVLVAAYIVKEMPIDYLRWLVIIVVLYAAAVMAHSALKGWREGKAEPATAPLAVEAEAEA